MEKVEKLNVQICMGTTCFVMGSSALQELLDIIPDKFDGEVTVTGVPCLDFCSNESEYSNAPYVKVGEEVVHSATVEKVIEVIERKLKDE